MAYASARLLEHRKILMRLPAVRVETLPEPALPMGYRCVPAAELGSDSKVVSAWAQIEVAAGEFTDTLSASTYFHTVFLVERPRARSQVWFVLDPHGNPVATASGWFAELNHDGGQQRVPCLHWVGVHPNFQGRGLGRAVSVQALHGMAGADVYLSTQTTALAAIRLYQSLGFCLEPRGTLSFGVVVNDSDGRPALGWRESLNEYHDALRVLAQVLDPAECPAWNENTGRDYGSKGADTVSPARYS